MSRLFFILALVLSAVAAFSPATFKRGSFAVHADCKTPDAKGRCPGEAGYYSQPVTDAPSNFADYAKVRKYESSKRLKLNVKTPTTTSLHLMSNATFG